MPLESYESNKKISDYKVVVVFIPCFLQLSLDRDINGLHLLSFDCAVFFL